MRSSGTAYLTGRSRCFSRSGIGQEQKMPAMKLKVTYLDDDREDVEIKVTPRAQVNTETHIGGDWGRMAILSLYHMAWGTLRKSDPENTPDFEKWLDTVEDVAEVAPAKPDPTQQDRSDEVSYL